MKYVAKGLFVLALLIVLATPAYAETATVQSNTDVTIQVTPSPKNRLLQRLPLVKERMEARQDARIELRTERQEGREELQEERQADRQERLENHWKSFAQRHYDRLKRRHAQYIERFNAIIPRLQANIDEKKKAGRDVSKPQAKLEEAKTAFVEAQTQSTTTLTALEKLSTSAEVEVQANVSALQTAQASGKAFLKVQMLLKEVVKLLKEVV